MAAKSYAWWLGNPVNTLMSLGRRSRKNERLVWCCFATVLDSAVVLSLPTVL
jgi:hypothetical protein